jgi:3-dehydroquinate synthase
MPSVEVLLAERSYSIFIGTKTLFGMAARLGESISNWSHAIVVVDANIASTIGKEVADQLSARSKRVTMVEVPSGEGHKSIEQLVRLWGLFLSGRADRKSVVVSVGGGVIGDLAGFAASTYTRGLRFVQVPTTLLAMVDSSVGGKTGINLPEAKNMIGAFWQPHAVWIDTDTLRSLPEREYRSGLAEVIKYGVILDKEFFAYLETHADAILERTPEHVEHIVRRSCEWKAWVVAQDERETNGLRAILNYGHTFGHAIEATTAYGQFLHGEAIAIGMTMAGRLAVRLGMWSEESLDRQTALLQRFSLPVAFSATSAQHLVNAMKMDKKTEHGKLHFILPTQLGNVIIVPCDDLRAIEESMA